MIKKILISLMILSLVLVSLVGAETDTTSKCQISECGPQLGIPNYLCSDEKTTAGPTGRCLQNQDSTCGWEVISCTETIQSGGNSDLDDNKKEIVLEETETTIGEIISSSGIIHEVSVTSVGEKKVISVSGATEQDCKEYQEECDEGDQNLCTKWESNCVKEETTVETKEEGKIYINEKEVKIMPDTASEKAIEVLEMKKEITIELKDVGKTIYSIEGVKDVKIVGLFEKEMLLKTEIDAETGDIISIEKPWWAFLAKE
jgi:uncharacterized protein (UPF0216 family)